MYCKLLARIEQPVFWRFPFASLLSQSLGLYSGLAQHTILAGVLSPLAYQASPMWIAVRQRFQQFHRNLLLTPLQSLDGLTKRNGVVNCLNRHYYGSTSETENSLLIGSWGKNDLPPLNRSS